MGDHETPQHELRNPFRPPRHVNTAPLPNVTSSSIVIDSEGERRGQGSTPTIRLDGFEDVRLKEPTQTSPTDTGTREGLGSKWLSSLSTANPTTAALSRSTTALHSRARSWAANFPKINTSPEKVDKSSNRQSKIFGDLFNGESAPVHLGVPTSPTKEDSEFVMEYRSGFTERPSTRRKESTGTIGATKPAAKTSWFSRKASMPAPAIPPPAAAQDEFISMNISTSLFPNGPGDELSPQAFNDLLLNATNLLQRMQAAYKEKVEYIDNVQPEIDAQKEEVEEVETRSKHLKMQLEDIGRQNQEQKQVNEELIIQLSEEKMKLQEAREAAKTIRLVRRETDGTEAGISDDEAARRRKRGSAGSASDSGFESDADTSSIFSAGMETPVSQRHPQLILTPDVDMTPSRHMNDRQLFSRSSTMSQQSTAFSSKRMGSESAAWATVEQLRHENQGLRMQLEQMQSNLQGVIDFVGGVHA